MLTEALDRALCNNPKTRQAWANVKVQAAAVGTARAGYLPTLSATWQDVRDNSYTDVKGHPELGSENHASIHSASISANWVLWDFGGRDAALRNAQALLAAARASHDATLQEVFSDIAKDYYAAQAAQGNLAAAKETETAAQASVTAASARVDKGVAPITDRLQTQTSHAQAVFARSKAEGELNAAIGKLASDMDMSPALAVVLPDVRQGVMPDVDFNASVTELMEEAKRTHPTVIVAERQYQAAVAKADQVQAQGMPSVGLTAKYSNNNQPASLGLGIPQYPATGRDWYVGVQVNIPLFEGFSRTYQVREAKAQSELRQYALDEARQKAALDVWISYQTLLTGTQNLSNTESLLDIAKRSFDATQHRYTAGVGNILELLNAQSALAEARKQRVQALSDWRNDRLQLASKLGVLDMGFLAHEDLARRPERRGY